MLPNLLLQPTNAALLALIPTTLDRIVVWGALALVVGLIAWREYTLPDVSSPPRVPDLEHGPVRRSVAPETVALLPGITAADAPPPPAEPQPLV